MNDGNNYRMFRRDLTMKNLKLQSLSVDSSCDTTVDGLYTAFANTLNGNVDFNILINETKPTGGFLYISAVSDKYTFVIGDGNTYYTSDSAGTWRYTDDSCPPKITSVTSQMAYSVEGGLEANLFIVQCRDFEFQEDNSFTSPGETSRVLIYNISEGAPSRVNFPITANTVPFAVIEGNTGQLPLISGAILPQLCYKTGDLPGYINWRS